VRAWQSGPVSVSTGAALSEYRCRGRYPALPRVRVWPRQRARRVGGIRHEGKERQEGRAG
jgi:hypothetical protein